MVVQAVSHVPLTQVWPAAQEAVQPIGPQHWQVVPRQVKPLAQQVPAQAAVVCWQPQVQVVVFKVWPLAQLVTQLPPHRVVPAGHWQEQVPLLKLAPPVQVLLTQRPLHRVVPAPHTHLQ